VLFRKPNGGKKSAKGRVADDEFEEEEGLCGKARKGRGKRNQRECADQQGEEEKNVKGEERTGCNALPDRGKHVGGDVNSANGAA